ncbi:MAG: MBL fold metallo-hydrolase [Thermotogae bacterium]|nr:MBL fold metallo-hydrolase [Thermotogota bacterium]
MEIVFLGTAAFEGYPNPFCNGEHCLSAISSSKNIDKRLRSAVLIDNRVLIDFGPDIVASSQKLGLNLSKVELLLITHSHEDHLYIPNFAMRQRAFNNKFDELIDMTVMASDDVMKKIIESEYSVDAKLILKPVAPFKTYEFGEYEITPVSANHYVGENEKGLLYLIQKDGKTLFYATDTGPFDNLYAENLKNKVNLNKIDLLILDATLGFTQSEYLGHNTYESFLQTLSILKTHDLLDDSSTIVAHHFSHHHNPNFHELQELYSRENILVSYDGMKIKV